MRDKVAHWIRANGHRLAAAARTLARDQDEVEDILQDAYLIAIRRAHELDPDADPGPWLYRVVRNVALSKVRKRARRKGLMRLWGPRAEDQVTQQTPGDRDSSDEAAIMRAVMRLPELQRDVVLKRIVEERSTRETAVALGCTEGTVKTSLFRAMRKLREGFRGPEKEDGDEDQKEGSRRHGSA